MTKWHVLAILVISLLWTSGVVATVACVYAFALSNVEDAEIRAVALTASIFVGFLLIRLPMAIFRAAFASYVVLPLMGFHANGGSSRRAALFNSWIRMLRSAGWSYDLAERPSYLSVAEEIRDAVRKIEGKLPQPHTYETVDVVVIVREHHAFDVGEDSVRGRIVDLRALHDEGLLRRLAAGARSESVRIAARRQLMDFHHPPTEDR